MTQKQLEDYLWGAANMLREMIDAADFKQYIFPLLFFKRVSFYDTFVVKQTFELLMNICAINPPLRVASKRYVI